MKLTSLIFAAATFLWPLQAQSEGRSIIVLDASGSMWGQIEGRAKLDIARDALAEVVQSIPKDTELGLIAYGHREKGSCADIELIVPPATGTAQAIADAAANMQFLGKTPLTDAVRQAAAALRSTEAKATVILITDGIETCQADPCALGLELEASGVDFTAHVVGFGLTEAEGQQVACLATNTGGQYITAADLKGLTLALQSVVIEAPPTPEPAPAPTPAPVPELPPPAALEVNFAPRVLLAPGITKPEDQSAVAWEIHTRNADGTTGERLTTAYNDPVMFFEPGNYRLVTVLDTVRIDSDLTLTPDTLAAPEIILNAARVILHPKMVAGGDVNTAAALTFTTASGVDTTGYGSTRLYLPAGEVTVTGTIGLASVSETLTLTAGQQLEQEIIIAAGLAVVDGYYTQGMVMDTTQHAVEIYDARKALDGSRTRLTTQYGPASTFELPAGDYVAVVSEGAAVAELAFTVTTGQRVDVPVILNAGVLAITAPQAASIEVFAAKTDINGQRKQVGFGYDTALTVTLPEGDYVIEAVQGDVRVAGTAVVKKGERSEMTLALP